MTVQTPRDPLSFDGVWDAVVIGGGFFGCSIATELMTEHGNSNVLVVERERDVMKRASYGNQARVHNGYHYPRSFTTGFRSHVNFPRFIERYHDCIGNSFIMLYCIAARNSLVTPGQFEKFCKQIGATCQHAAEPLRRLFNPNLIEAVYETTEIAFDARLLAEQLRREMNMANVRLLLDTNVTDVTDGGDGMMVTLVVGDETVERRTRQIFNCTYAGLNRLGPNFGPVRAQLKYEIAEIALVTVPPPLAGLGVTVMDGPFFSCMPFPAAGCHSLSHVRYTPHVAWLDSDDPETHPLAVLEANEKRSRARYMIADASRYLPLLKSARYEQSIFEVKTVLLSNEIDDGRPILFERHASLPGAYSILGGKFDNIFDVLDAMRQVLAEAHRP